MGKKLNITAGTKFGRLDVIREVKPACISGRKIRQFLCKCGCDGNTDVYKLQDLRSGHTQSCGCFHRERASISNIVHGMYGHPLYIAWKNMHSRCYNPNNIHFKHYGGRGIEITYRPWRSKKTGFQAFVAWNKSLPKDEQRKPGLSLHREDNDKGYSPDNCMWASNKIQSREKQNTYKRKFRGKVTAERDIYDILKSEDKIHPDVSYKVFMTRLHRRSWWSLQEAATEGLQTGARRDLKIGHHRCP